MGKYSTRRRRFIIMLFPIKIFQLRRDTVHCYKLNTNNSRANGNSVPLIYMIMASSDRSFNELFSAIYSMSVFQARAKIFSIY